MNVKFVILGGVLWLATALMTVAQYTGTGIGLRGGDPSGLTLKLYQGSSAIEINFGTTVFWWSTWAGKRAEKAALAAKPHPEDNLVSWTGYYTSGRRIGLQFVYQPIFSGFNLGALSGFHWYLGFGGQVNYGSLVWEAWYDHPDPYGNWLLYDHYRSGRVSDIDVGPVGMIGVEWILTDYDIPIALALDLSGFLEVLDQPFGKLYFIGNGSIRLLIDEL